MDSDPIAEFRAAIAGAGITVPEQITADGKFHRFATNGKARDDAGWYFLHLDGVPAGAFGCLRSGITEKWKANGREFTLEERREYGRRMEAARLEKKAAERNRHTEASERATRIWNEAEPGDHGYLTRKGVKAHGALIHEGRLTVPVRDEDGNLASLQFIYPDGHKKFMHGGRTGGCYFAIGKPDDVLCIAEGFGTAASIRESTGHAVACAFAANNIKPVALALRAKFPDIRIIICGDNDLSNTGQTAAREAAEAIGASTAIPKEPGDWNDVHAREGADAVRKGVNSGKRLSQLASLADVQPIEIEWLWPGRFAIGKVSMLAGDPGLGKSILALAIATHVSLGSRWPVEGGQAPVGDVVLLSAEDDAADTIRPRLDAAGADVRRLYMLSMIRTVDEAGKPAERMFSLERDIELLDREVAGLPDCRLVVIDPISAYLGATDSHKNSDVRGLLAPLAELASRRRVAVIGVTHLNKGGGKAIYRTMGSLAFVAAARAVFGVVKDEDTPSRRLLLPVKNNLGPDADGLAYDIQVVDNVPVLRWEPDPVTVSMDDALYRDDERNERDDAAEWLKEQLKHGPVLTTTLKASAKGAGISWRTLERAKSKAGAKAHKQDFSGKWEWGLRCFYEDRQHTEDRQHSGSGGLGGLGGLGDAENRTTTPSVRRPPPESDGGWRSSADDDVEAL